jgi:hypothetical protein
MVRPLSRPLTSGTLSTSTRIAEAPPHSVSLDVFEALRHGSTGPDLRPSAKHADGAIMGLRGHLYEGDTRLADVTPVLPSNGEPQGLALFVNGALCDPEDQHQKMQQLADAIGKAVVGVHNQAHGLTGLLRMVAGRLGLPVCGAVKTVKELIRHELLEGREVHLFAYSHGALIAADALKQLQKELELPDAELEQLLGRCEVETWGGAAAVFPKGPVYRHLTNDFDPIVRLFGLGTGALRSRVDQWKGFKSAVKSAAESTGAAAVRMACEVVGSPGEGSEHQRFSELPALPRALPSCWDDAMPPHAFRLYLNKRMEGAEAPDPV